MLLTYCAGWEKVQEALQGFLTETRATRLEEERKATVKQRFADLDEAIVAHCVTLPRNMSMDCRPVALDLALQEELEPIANAPTSETITRERLAAIIPKLVANWHAEQRQVIQSFLVPFITRVPRGVDILDLAIAVIYRKSYSNTWTLHYPHVLTNNCFRRSSCWRDEGKFTSSHYAAVVVASEGWKGPFSLEFLEQKHAEVGIRWMRNIVANLGLDPDTATIADLERCEARVQCLKCAELGEPVHACTWEAAVSSLCIE